MGKASYSPLGQWRNKVGGQVYRIDSGEQIISAYQPVVKNPRTDSQQNTRTKFTSATRYIAGFKPFIDVMNPTGSRRMVRGTIMKKIMATMDQTTISHVRQNGNLVLNATDLFSVAVNPATASGNSFVVVGSIVLEDGILPSDFVNSQIRIYLGIQFLNEDGSKMARTIQSVDVTLSSAMEFTFEVTYPDTIYTGALFEVAGIGVLTADAWARFSAANGIFTNDNTGSIDEYSESVARQLSANVGRGVLRP